MLMLPWHKRAEHFETSNRHMAHLTASWPKLGAITLGYYADIVAAEDNPLADIAGVINQIL
jgi:imidazolonepropionase-like amidohydrolase